jgi:hypothetical protein
LNQQIGFASRAAAFATTCHFCPESRQLFFVSFSRFFEAIGASGAGSSPS